MPLNRQKLARLRGELVAHVAFGFRNALEAVGHNKLRAGLTSMGILFGVASVIAMLAIGKGAEQEILDQMRLLGSNTIIVQPLVEQSEGDVKEDEKQPRRFTPGLSLADARAVAAVMPNVQAVSGEIVLNTTTTREGRRRSGKLVGVDPAYFQMNNLELGRGTWFTETQLEQGLPVAIIGRGVRTRFFTTEDPIGKTIKVGDTWLTVVGVLADRRLTGETGRMGIRDANMDVYIPIQTMLSRFRDRSRVTQAEIERLARLRQQPQPQQEEQVEEDEEARSERLNRNQLDRILVQMDDSRHVTEAADVLRRMLTRRHNNVVDFEIVIPEMLLKQEQRAKTIFNVVLGAIASISLIVGGIGIMNIMLASVLERIREIGVRRAMGATQRDILIQFLSEAVLISVAGGLAGVLVGGGISLGIERFAGISTIVSYASVFVAFGVSLSVGLLFGIVPAYRAAQQDPVVCLRYE